MKHSNHDLGQAGPAFSKTELKDFLAKANILIASEHTSTPKAIRKMLIDFGAKFDSIFLGFEFEVAARELLLKPYHILITDIHFMNDTGLKLIEAQESQFKNRLGVASIVMSPIPANSEKVMIAKSNVDAVLIKPVTGVNFAAACAQALEEKIRPSEFRKKIEIGKERLEAGDILAANQCFEEASRLRPDLALPSYYLGVAQLRIDAIEKAILFFEAALKIDPRDFRCLNAIFETRLRSSEHQLAYEAAAKMHQFYPVGVDNIIDLIKLSIYVKKYDDIVDYFEVFKSLKNRDPRLNRVVIAGMLICAKYMAQRGDGERCVEILSCVSKTALESKLLMLDVFRVMIELRQYSIADRYFSAIPAEMSDQREAKILFLELVAATEDSGGIAAYAMRLLKEGVKTPRIYRLAIEHSRQMNRSEKVISDLIEEANLAFPDEGFDKAESGAS